MKGRTSIKTPREEFTEKEVESYLGESIRDIGGITRKFNCVNRRGVPDQIVIYEGIVAFVECKSSIGGLSGIQEREIRRLRDVGAKVFVVRSKKSVDGFITWLKFFGDTKNK